MRVEHSGTQISYLLAGLTVEDAGHVAMSWMTRPGQARLGRGEEITPDNSSLQLPDSSHTPRSFINHS